MDFYQYLDSILVVIGLIVTVILAAVGFKAEEQGAKKTCKRLAFSLLCLIVGLTIFYFYSNHNEKAKDELAARTEVIKNFVFEAQKLADENDYIGAISLLKAALSEYPDDVQLSEKLKLYEDTFEQYEGILDGLMKEINEYTANENYSQAIILIEDALKLYPSNSHLKEMLKMYTGIVLEEEKAEILVKAQGLFASGEYEAALSLIKAAQDAYGTTVEFEDIYRDYQKKYTLYQAEGYILSGDYVNSIRVLAEGLKISPNDLDLISRYNDCCDTYVKGIISEADALAAERKIDEAIGVIKAALEVLPDNEKLADKLATLKDSKPIPITNLISLNPSGWYWNEGNPVDPFGNNFSSACNYVTFANMHGERSIEYRVYGNYSMVTGIIAPHEGIGKDLTCTVRVYADDQIIYSSPAVGQKTDAFLFTADISGAEYIKIEMRPSYGTYSSTGIILSDIQLWP